MNDEPGDFVGLFIQGEMPGIQQMNLGMWHIAVEPAGKQRDQGIKLARGGRKTVQEHDSRCTLRP